MKIAKHQLLYFSIFFILTVSVVSHLLFSWIGFNPTDDGFILSLSRRIIDGQFPHRDFIFIRPALSPVIHVPFVYFGGEYTFWFSRLFVWIELASISCIWTIIILHKFFSMKFNFLRDLFFASACFVFSTYTAFIFAYTTYDALLFYSLGLLLCLGEFKFSRSAGYIVIGLAYLCRQNFLFVIPVSLWFFGDLRRIKYWVVVLLPGAFYLLLMLLNGALNDFISQAVSLRGQFHGGIKVYVTNWGFWVFMVLGFVLMLIIGRGENLAKEKYKGYSILRWFVYLSVPVISLSFLNKEIYPLLISFSIFGFVSGITLYLVIKKQPKFFKPGIFLLLSGWVVSVSVGMSYPALFSGEYILFIMIIVLKMYDENSFSEERLKLWLNVTGIILFFIIVSGFVYARLVYTYRDKSSFELNYKIEKEIKGTKNIQTNVNTYLFLEDLNKAVSLTSGRTYCILPDLSAYWVQSSVENPLPFSWANKTELNVNVFNIRVREEIELKKGMIIILQKVFANSIQKDSSGIKLNDAYSPVIPFIKENFNKITETSYFELYE